MSFHIKLQKDKSLDFKIAVALYFLNFFREHINLLDYRIRSKGEIKHLITLFENIHRNVKSQKNVLKSKITNFIS